MTGYPTALTPHLPAWHAMHPRTAGARLRFRPASAPSHAASAHCTASGSTRTWLAIDAGPPGQPSTVQRPAVAAWLEVAPDAFDVETV
jgi:hypothetical protein